MCSMSMGGGLQGLLFCSVKKQPEADSFKCNHSNGAYRYSICYFGCSNTVCTVLVVINSTVQYNHTNYLRAVGRKVL